MSALSLVSLNIERSKHLDLVLPFLQEQHADVVCIQECMQHDFETLEEVIGAKGSLFVPLVRFGPTEKEKEGVYGMAIFSTLAISDSGAEYYVGTPENISFFDNATRGTARAAEIEKIAKAVAFVDVTKDSTTYRILETHFTWTPDGHADDRQRRNLKELLRVLESQEEFVLVGDFNAPREIEGKAGEIFSELASRYKDNVPDQYRSSLDPDLHSVAGKFDLMVDGLFSSPAYAVSDVRMVCGLSDHCALVANISKLDVK